MVPAHGERLSSGAAAAEESAALCGGRCEVAFTAIVLFEVEETARTLNAVEGAVRAGQPAARITLYPDTHSQPEVDPGGSFVCGGAEKFLYFIPSHTVRSFSASPLLKRVALHQITQSQAFIVILLLLYITGMNLSIPVALFVVGAGAGGLAWLLNATQILLVAALALHLTQLTRSKVRALVATAEFWFLGSQLATASALQAWVVYHHSVSTSGVVNGVLHAVNTPLACLAVVCIDASFFTRVRKGVVMATLSLMHFGLCVVWQLALDKGDVIAESTLIFGPIVVSTGSLAQSTLLTVALFQAKYATRCLVLRTDAALFSFCAMRDTSTDAAFETEEQVTPTAAEPFSALATDRAVVSLYQGKESSGSLNEAAREGAGSATSAMVDHACSSLEQQGAARGGARSYCMSEPCSSALLREQLATQRLRSATIVVLFTCPDRTVASASVSTLTARVRECCAFAKCSSVVRPLRTSVHDEVRFGARTDYVPMQMVTAFSPRPILSYRWTHAATAHVSWPYILALLYGGGMCALVVSGFWSFPGKTLVQTLSMLCALIAVSIHVTHYSRAFVLHLARTFDFWFLSTCLMCIAAVDAYQHYVASRSILNVVLHMILTLVACVAIFCMDATVSGSERKGWVMLVLGLMNIALAVLWQREFSRGSGVSRERITIWIFRVHVGSLARSAAAALAFFELKYALRSLYFGYDAVVLSFLAKESSPALTIAQYTDVPHSHTPGAPHTHIESVFEARRKHSELTLEGSSLAIGAARK